MHKRVKTVVDLIEAIPVYAHNVVLTLKRRHVDVV